MSEPVETTGKKSVAFRPKREYNVGVWSVECGVWSVECGVWSDGIAFGDELKYDYTSPHSSLFTLHSQLFTLHSCQ